MRQPFLFNQFDNLDFLDTAGQERRPGFRRPLDGPHRLLFDVVAAAAQGHDRDMANNFQDMTDAFDRLAFRRHL